ncbi:hypothetical protein FHS85_003984 [Rhodoligotrophos appendicifer]|uniref:hypothetical protein n=1 Tax=Rhodoligotrophos appendicifer TaxID=987056 RepID=UPI001185FA7B|nr:hypothetical protein [Rhodoligotrophos appendicifer]
MSNIDPANEEATSAVVLEQLKLVVERIQHHVCDANSTLGSSTDPEIVAIVNRLQPIFCTEEARGFANSSDFHPNPAAIEAFL